MYPAGSIHWLPPKDRLPSEQLLAAKELDEGCLNHPVVILAADAALTKAAILIITSLSGTDLLKKFPRNENVRAAHLPIYPSSAHPDNGVCLHLADGERLCKPSYVKIKPIRIVRVGMLRPWGQGRCRLETKSLRELLQRVKFQSPWPNIKHVQIPVAAPLSVSRQLPMHCSIPVQHSPPELGHNYQPRTISCGSNYHVPGQWVSTYDRSTYIQTYDHHTPLLPPRHDTVRTPARATYASSCVNFVFMLIFAAILLLVTYMWYIGTP